MASEVPLNLQRTAAVEAGRAATEAPTKAARHAARAAAAASAAAYLHPLAKATQVGHILGAAAEAARAGELARGDDPVVAEYLLDAAAKRMSPEVRDVLGRYPRATAGSTRVSALMARLDGLLRDPPPPKRVVDDEGPFFHGTRADVQPGDLLTPGWRSNYGSRRESNNIYVTARSTSRRASGALRSPQNSPAATVRRGSIGSSRWARSWTTPTSPTRSSPATPPGPIARRSRFE